jgi:hypothetical protein
MFTPKQYSAKTAEFGELIKNTDVPGKIREFQDGARGFISLAQDEKWLADNFNKTILASGEGQIDSAALAEQGEHILRCLGAAVILRWNTIPTKLQRELFDTAGSMGDLLQTAALRGQLARFLHKHKDNEAQRLPSSSQAGGAVISVCTTI